MFAIEHSNVVPDIITMAKTLGGGLPLAATICRADVVDVVQVGGLGGTFGGNPVSCVAALKTIEIVQRYLDNVPKLGSILMSRLKEMQEKYEVIGDVRGLGLMVGVELVKNRKTKEPAKELRDKVISECYRNGLIIMGAGAYHNVIRFLPPLNISEELLNKGLDIFENALKASLTK
jgi:4-aminobutyrate aminotransferase/(S)-3-amino-2-methylpropionate transaminase